MPTEAIGAIKQDWWQEAWLNSTASTTKKLSVPWKGSTRLEVSTRSQHAGRWISNNSISRLHSCTMTLKKKSLWVSLPATMMKRSVSASWSANCAAWKRPHAIRTKGSPIRRTNFDEARLILTIYIDYGLIATVDANKITLLLQELRKEFEITTDAADMFLGLQVEQESSGAIFLH